MAWPDPHAPGCLTPHGKPSTVSAPSTSLFPIWGLRFSSGPGRCAGLPQFLIDMALDPEYVEALLDRITEIQLALIDRYLDLGVDGGYFGDDYGAQTGLLISPAMWRTLIKPRLAHLFAPFRARRLPVLMHSDGQIQAILPDLVEIGLTVLNPVQPEVLDHAGCNGTLVRSWRSTAGSPPRQCSPTAAPRTSARQWRRACTPWRPPRQACCWRPLTA